uniref:Uncharacterized protein n=1 Tax=Cacopsylla melanoneura TaxID=428564 RepID=A0A8D8QFF9_9HEMI
MEDVSLLWDTWSNLAQKIVTLMIDTSSGQHLSPTPLRTTKKPTTPPTTKKPTTRQKNFPQKKSPKIGSVSEHDNTLFHFTPTLPYFCSPCTSITFLFFNSQLPLL